MTKSKPVSFLLLLFIGLLFSQKLVAQNQDVAGYDTSAYHPLFIQSKDGRFLLNIGMYTQFRYNLAFQANVPDTMNSLERGYSLARTRIFLEGNLTEKFYYHTRININPAGNFELIAAFLQWNINQRMWIRAGRQWMALGREDWMYPQDLASVEFSANDFTYAIWSSFGLQFRHVTGDKFRYYVSIGNGAYGGRQGFPAPDPADFTVIGRGEWNILGEGWANWDDMTSRRGREFGLLLGFSVGNSLRSEADLMPDDFKTATQFNLDLSAAGNGFHAFAASSLTARNYVNNGLNNYVWGVYSTGGYWFTRCLFGYVRIDVVGRGDLTTATEDYIAPGFGVSFYPFKWTNRTRLTAEYNALPATITNTIVVPDGQLGWTASPYGSQQAVRIQLQFGF